MRRGAGELLATLLAALLATLLAGGATLNTQRSSRAARSIVEPVDRVDGASAASGSDGGDAANGVDEVDVLPGYGVSPDSSALEAMAAVPEWAALWRGALAARRREPSFNSSHETVLVQRGASAFLHCPVQDLGERGVSWVRRRDWHIISSGLFMYTNDERFQVLHNEGSDDWILQIKYVQKRDNGTYECQVSTSRGIVSRQVSLSVAVPEALILGADEHHVDKGSALNLVCIIENSPVPPQYVFWYHNARMINYDTAAGVRVNTQAGSRTQSALAVSSAEPRHSGNYSCRAPNTEPAHIYVYVSEGSDKMAATLSRNSSQRACSAELLATLLATLLGRALASH